VIEGHVLRLRYGGYLHKSRNAGLACPACRSARRHGSRRLGARDLRGCVVRASGDRVFARLRARPELPL